MGSQGLAGRGRRHAAQVVGWEGPGSDPAPAAGARRRRGALVLTGAVLASLVVGCSSTDPVIESPAPVVSEEPSPTPTPTPTSTGPVKPERPADMDRTDEVGAAAAATYFLELYPYVMATGDLAEWDAMTWEETCEFCTTVRSESVTTMENGYAYTGAELELSSVTVGALDTLIGGYPVVADYVQSPHRSEGAAGEVISEDDGSSGRLQIDTLHTNDGWKILALVVEG